MNHHQASRRKGNVRTMNRSINLNGNENTMLLERATARVTMRLETNLLVYWCEMSGVSSATSGDILTQVNILFTVISRIYIRLLEGGRPLTCSGIVWAKIQ